MGEREGREPGFAAEGPAFVGGGELIGRVEGAEMDLDLAAAGEGGEDGGAADGAEVAAFIVARLAFDGHRVGGEDGGGEEQGAMMLAAVQAVAEAGAVGLANGGEADGAAEARGGVLGH